MTRVGRVLDASDPRVDPGPRRRRGTPRRDVRAGRDYAIRNPEDALLVRVNDDEGPLTSIDRSRLRAMGYTPWDEKPGYDGQSYAEAHGVTFDHDEFRAAQEEEFALEERRHEITDRLRKQHESNRPIGTPEPIREAQERLILRLLGELEGLDRATYAIAKPWCDTELPGMTKTRASEVISRLKSHCGYEEGTWKKRADFVAPDASSPAVDTSIPIDYFEDVPDAYYALPGDEGDDHIRFFRVSTWKRPFRQETRPGRKVEVVIGGNREAPMSRASARTVLREIRASGPEAAARLFGQKIGSCARCGRSLTDASSRAAGIGPTCEGKGW